MRLFIHTEGEHDPHLLEFQETTTVQELIVASGGDVEVDLLWIEEEDGPLAREAILIALGVREDHHLHRHRCRHVEVMIQHNGEKEHRFPPSATVEQVFRWAVSERGFNIPESQRPKFVLAVCGADEFLDQSIHIGSLTAPDACSVCLDLAPRDRFEG